MSSSSAKPEKSTTMLDRILSIEIVRVTERAAVAAARLSGRGNEKDADQAAVDAMRREMNKLEHEGLRRWRRSLASTCRRRPRPARWIPRTVATS